MCTGKASISSEESFSREPRHKRGRIRLFYKAQDRCRRNKGFCRNPAARSEREEVAVSGPCDGNKHCL